MHHPRTRTCGICGELTNKPTRMCRDCDVSYERQAQEDGSGMEAMLWAARRARWYAQRRAGRRQVRVRLAARRSDDA
jgi:hypothetical protein